MGLRSGRGELPRSVSSGHVGLDTITDGLRLGDNVVWQVDDIDDFRRVVDPYIAQARTDGRTIVYVRFASHPPLIDDVSDIHVHEVDPTEGFESFATRSTCLHPPRVSAPSTCSTA